MIPSTLRQQIFLPALSDPGQAGGLGSVGPSGPESVSLSHGLYEALRVIKASYLTYMGMRERPHLCAQRRPCNPSEASDAMEDPQELGCSGP